MWADKREKQDNVLIDWNQNMMLEVTLDKPDDFLKIKETLTRMGIASTEKKILYQSCHILHKRGRYFIVHFKEMFILDGKPTNLSLNDIKRRNSIALLLDQWNLLKIQRKDIIENTTLSPNEIAVITHAEKQNWTIVTKYKIGKVKSKFT